MRALGHAAPAVGKGVGVGAGGPAGCFALDGDVVVGGGPDDEIEQFVVDGGCVSDAGAEAALDVADLLFVEHGRVGVVRDIGDDGHVGTDVVRDHLGTAQADFFLHRIDDVERIGEFDLVFLQQAGYFGNAETTHAIIQGAADVVAVVEDFQFVGVGR